MRSVEAAVEDDQQQQQQGDPDEAGEDRRPHRVLAERRRDGVHAQDLDVGRERAAVEDPGQRAGLALGEVAGDRHRVGERRLAHDRGRLDDVVEDDRQLVAGAGVGAVVALGGERVPARRARAAEPDVDGPALLLAELHAGAVALEDLVAGAAGRADDALAAVDLTQDGRCRDSVVAGDARRHGRVARDGAAGDRRGRRCRPHGRAGSVVGGAASARDGRRRAEAGRGDGRRARRPGCWPASSRPAWSRARSDPGTEEPGTDDGRCRRRPEVPSRPGRGAA